MKKKIGLIVLVVSLLTWFGCGGSGDTASSGMVYRPERMCEGPCDVVWVGDSMTDYGPFGELDTGEDAYCNCGISGLETGGIIERLDRYTKHGAHTAFLMIGVNDINHAGCLPDFTFPNYQFIVTSLEDAGMEVIIQLTLHTSGSYAHSNRHIAQLNRLIRNWCEDTGRYYVDPNEALCPDGELIVEYTWDGLHCNELGYVVWVSWLRDLGLIP